MDSGLELELLRAIELPPLSIYAGTGDLAGAVLEVDVSDVDEIGVWIRLAQSGTAASGVDLEPFAVVITDDLWFQGWADGDTLTVAASPAGIGAAVGFARGFLAAARPEGRDCERLP